MKIWLMFTLILSSSVSVASEASKVEGLWLSEEKDGIIKIENEDDTFFGHLVWIKPKDGKTASEFLDIENPEKDLQDRKLLGIKLLEGFEYDDGSWSGGTIYDPKSGKTYSAKMKLEDGKLNLRGYVGISLFGRTSIWSSVKDIPKD
jgi:uncharacterized protein (DUF2147 family)